MLLSELETFRERTSLLFLWLFRLFLVSLWDLIAEYCGLQGFFLNIIINSNSVQKLDQFIFNIKGNIIICDDSNDHDNGLYGI